MSVGVVFLPLCVVYGGVLEESKQTHTPNVSPESVFISEESLRCVSEKTTIFCERMLEEGKKIPSEIDEEERY